MTTTTTLKSNFKKATEKQAELLRKSALAYAGLHGLAYDKFVERIRKNRELRENLFAELVEKGEAVEKQTAELTGKYRRDLGERFGAAGETVTGFVPKFGAKAKARKLEAELAELTEQFEKLSKKSKAAAKKTAKKTVKKATTTIKTVKADAEVKTTKAVKAVETKVEAVKEEAQAQLFDVQKDSKADKLAKAKAAVAETVATVAPKAAQTAPKAEARKEPRHIPYFNDVKRYDPLASEDVVRKIVNHCGIALRSEDARFVACSDESERATVRDSWLKRKLGLDADDAALDKKVLEVCSLMQRDQRKNRVTFYYLLAKKERMLETL